MLDRMACRGAGKRASRGLKISRSLIRKLGPVERQAIRLISEAMDVPPLTRKRAQAILLAESGMRVAIIAVTVGLTKTEVLLCLERFDTQGMHALYT
jgi:hypothetical protein